MTYIIFSAAGYVAIAAAGILSAFTARRPARLMSWLSAYLVIVVGLLQIGLVASWQMLGGEASELVRTALISYNIGSGLVIIGTIEKHRGRSPKPTVAYGCGLILLAMVLLGLAVGGASLSWVLVWFWSLVLTVLAGVSVGLARSLRRGH